MNRGPLFKWSWFHRAKEVSSSEPSLKNLHFDFEIQNQEK